LLCCTSIRRSNLCLFVFLFSGFLFLSSDLYFISLRWQFSKIQQNWKYTSFNKLLFCCIAITASLFHSDPKFIIFLLKTPGHIITIKHSFYTINDSIHLVSIITIWIPFKEPSLCHLWQKIGTYLWIAILWWLKNS